MSQRFIIDRGSIASKIIDGDVVAINLATGDYFSLSGSAEALWTVLTEGAGLDEMMAAVAAHYRDVPADAADQVARFLDRLIAEALVVAAPAGAPGVGVPVAGAARKIYQPPVLEKFDDMAMMLALDPPMPDLPGPGARNPGGATS